MPPAKRGNAPISVKDRKPIEIHHEKQKRLGPYSEEHSSDHKEIDHPERISQVDRDEFNRWRREYWRDEWDNGRFK